jgi:hypothetical protein
MITHIFGSAHHYSSSGNNIFDDFMSNHDEINSRIDHELSSYVNFGIINDTKLDLLSWWAEHKNIFKNLYQMHTKIHAIPATSAASERAFSAAGNVINEKRTRLCTKTVNNLIVANSNLKYNTVNLDD